MPLPDPTLDTAVAFGFMVKIDGVQVPSVTTVSDITMEVESVDYNQQTSDGKFVPRRLAARQKGGEFTVTRGMTADKVITDWLNKVAQGDLGAARKTAEVAVLDYQGQPLRRYSFENCWVKNVKMNSLEAGGTNVITEEFTVSYDSMKAE